MIIQVENYHVHLKPLCFIVGRLAQEKDKKGFC